MPAQGGIEISEKTLLLCCSFGLPFLAAALVIGGVGYVLRRVRPDLYMTDEEKREAAEKPAAGSNAEEGKDGENK
ncbi:MAG: hypothetical protein K6C68_07715 [Ruminococcus sp.]|nr:hypothetical protein [Ruminococcus sp.]